MRVAIGGYLVACNTFATQRIGLERFQRAILTGDAVLRLTRGDGALGGFAEAARASNRPVDEIVADRLKTNPAGRAGNPAEFGDACAFLCSANISFIIGHNLLLDGGAFNSSIA